jgi:endonuclease YncB( thermonuclease family)
VSLSAPLFFRFADSIVSPDKGNMGDVFDFREHLGKRKRRWLRRYGPVVATGVAIGGTLAIGVVQLTASAAPSQKVSANGSETADTFVCNGLRVVDGDTLRCGSVRVRLASIDAPEVPGHCNPGRSCTPGDPYASTDNLSALVAGADVQCRKTDVDRYGRTVALCSANGRDLSCAQYQGGFAVERYGRLVC